MPLLIYIKVEQQKDGNKNCSAIPKNTDENWKSQTLDQNSE